MAKSVSDMRIPWRAGARAAVLPVAALILAAVPLPPALVERAFSTGAYAHVQPWLTRLSNRAPIAWLDALIALTVAVAVWVVVTTWRSRAGLARWLARLGWTAIQASATLYLVFLVVWGFNYRRVGGSDRFDVDGRRVVETRLRGLAIRAVDEANRLWPARRDERPLTGEALVSQMAPGFAEAARLTGTTWRVEPGRPKLSLLAGAFPLADVDGLTNPFGLEVILNPEVLPFERPFVLAHEWGHLAGYADEGEASFAAFVTCLKGPPPAQYSGWLSLLLHALGGLPTADRQAIARRLGPGPRADIRAIVARGRRAQPLVRSISWRVYDRYLKANRVAEGVGSYDAVTRLVLGAALTAPLADPAPELPAPAAAR